MANPSSDEDELLARMEQNLAEHACHLHRQLTGAAVAEAGDLLVADSGLDDDTFNIVAAARMLRPIWRRSRPPTARSSAAESKVVGAFDLDAPAWFTLSRRCSGTPV